MHLLFDLDGTLTDSREGIVRCIQHALGEMGRQAPPAQELTRFVGPPLASSFSALLDTSDAALIDQAIATYRSRFERFEILEDAAVHSRGQASAETRIPGFAGFRLSRSLSRLRHNVILRHSRRICFMEPREKTSFFTPFRMTDRAFSCCDTVSSRRLAEMTELGSRILTGQELG